MLTISIARREARGCGVATVLKSLSRDENVVHFTREEQVNKDWAFVGGVKSCYYRFIRDLSGTREYCRAAEGAIKEMLHTCVMEANRPQ